MRALAVVGDDLASNVHTNVSIGDNRLLRGNRLATLESPSYSSGSSLRRSWLSIRGFDSRPRLICLINRRLRLIRAGKLSESEQFSEQIR